MLAIDLFPVLFKIPTQYHAIEELISFSLLKGEDAIDENEHDDARWEHVYLLTIILFTFFYFRSHVRFRASIGGKLVNVTICSKTEIGDFEVQVLIKQNVLKLEVTMDDVLRAHVLLYIKQLLKEETTGILSEPA